MYAYQAYLETRFSYGLDSKDSQLTGAMYYKDTAGQMDDADPTVADPPNKGLSSRFQFFANSRTADMMEIIHSNLMFQDKFLPADVGLSIHLTRNRDAFCLVSRDLNQSYKLVIMDCKLYVRKVRVSPSVYIGHAKALEHSNAKYPIRRAVCKTFIVSNGL